MPGSTDTEEDGPVDYPQDPRTVGILGRFGASGKPMAVTRQDMLDEAARWPLSEHTPGTVAGQLRVSRDLFVHCLLVWEFGAVGAAWSLLAVESCIRWALDAPEKTVFKNLVDRAHQKGLLTDDLKEKVDAGRQLRNLFSHPKNQPAWPLGMTGGAIKQSHVVVHHISEVVATRRAPTDAAGSSTAEPAADG